MILVATATGYGAWMSDLDYRTWRKNQEDWKVFGKAARKCEVK